MNSPFYTGSRPSNNMDLNCSGPLVMRIFFSSKHFIAVGFAGGTVVKNPPADAEDAGDSGSAPGSGRSPGGGHGNPLHYSCLGNPMNRGAWWATVHGVPSGHDWVCARAHTHTHTHTPSTTPSKDGWLCGWGTPCTKSWGYRANCEVTRGFPTARRQCPDSSIVGGSAIFSHWRKLISDSS